MQGELPGAAADLVLEEPRHHIWTQFHVGATVAAFFVVVGSRENGDYLLKYRGENIFDKMADHVQQEA